MYTIKKSTQYKRGNSGLPGGWAVPDKKKKSATSLHLIFFTSWSTTKNDEKKRSYIAIPTWITLIKAHFTWKNDECWPVSCSDKNNSFETIHNK